MSTPTKPPSKSQDASAGLREHLALLLNPVEAVLLTRERLQEVLDDAVRRGRMTRDDATDLVQELVTRGRANTEAVLSDVDQLLGSPADKVRSGVDRARRVTGIGSSSSFPIDGYENLTAAEITQRLGDLDDGELRRVRDYERRNGNRKTVLSAVDGRLG